MTARLQQQCLDPAVAQAAVEINPGGGRQALVELVVLLDHPRGGIRERGLARGCAETCPQRRVLAEPLKEAGKLGAVFLQFPRWVFPSNESRELILDARRRLGVEVAAEFRNASWFNEKNAERTVKFLQDNKIPYVAVDEPQGFKSSVPPVVIVTNEDLAVFRFHGRNKDNWEKKDIPPSERFRYLYDEDELADWTPKIVTVARQTRQTHVIYNNCYSNYGTTNAREAARLLAEMQS